MKLDEILRAQSLLQQLTTHSENMCTATGEHPVPPNILYMTCALSSREVDPTPSCFLSEAKSFLFQHDAPSRCLATGEGSIATPDQDYCHIES